MDENKNTAQTSGNANGDTSAVGQAYSDAVTDKQGDDGSTATFTDGENKSADKGNDRERNAEYARRRREAERQKELKEAREKAIIDALDGINPFTDEAMKDSHDVEEFLMMQEIKKNGGDPVADFSKTQKERGREAAQKQAEAEEKTAWYRKDKADFVAAYPDVNLEELIGNESFQDYADGKVGVKPLKSIYEGFLRFNANAAKGAKASAAQALANSKASPGALSTSGSSEDGYFTREQVKAMSQAEVSRNFEKIKKSMPRWD